jgi:hypothetical protein
VGEDNFWRAYCSGKGMPEAMVVWTMAIVMKGREEANGSREEMLQEEKQKTKKEQKRKEKNAELRRRTKAMAIAYRQAECEYYYEEAEQYHEEREYDEEQHDHYYQDHIRKQLCQRHPQAIVSEKPASQDINQGTAEGRRKCSYEGGKRKNKRRRSRSPLTRWNNSKSKRTRTTRRGRGLRSITTLLDGFENGWRCLRNSTERGGTNGYIEDGITDTAQNTPQRRHAQSQDKHNNRAAVDLLQLPRPTFADEQERSLHYQKEHPHPGPSRCNSTGIWQDQMESTWVFTYWKAGDNDSPPPRGLKKRPMTATCGQYHGLSHEPAPSRLKSFREFRKIGRVAAH